MKKIMILGAGIYQVPLIKTARRLNLYTIVVSIPGNYPGFAYADKIYHLDTRDKEAILQAARTEGIDGICTSGTDVAVRTIGYVCEKMGLHGIPYEGSVIVTDKALMKEAFLHGNVSGSRFYKVTSEEEARTAAASLGYPVILKRVDSSGSRGISIVHAEKNIPEAYQHAVSGSSREYILVESLLTGQEIGVDGFVLNGKLVFVAPHTKFVYHGKNITIPYGHAFPYSCTETVQQEITRQMQAAVTAAGIDNCPVNADVFVDGESVSIIEIGGRTGATCIPELISMYYGFDFYELMLKNALGEPVTFPSSNPVPCMAKLLVSPINGTITQIDYAQIQQLLQSNPGYEIVLDYQIGDSVSEMCNGTDRIGHVIAPVDKETVLDSFIAKIYSCIEVNHQKISS